MKNFSSLLHYTEQIDNSKKTICTIESQIAEAIERKTKNKKKYIDEHNSMIANEQKYMKSCEECLVEAKKELFVAIQKDIIPADRIPAINAFFSEYQKPPRETSDNEMQDIFDHIDIDKIPAEKVPATIWFFADYLSSSYKKTMFPDVKPFTYSNERTFLEDTNMNNTNYNTAFSVRIYNILKSSDLRVLWDLLVAYKANPKFLLNYRGLGRKSNEEVKEFLAGHKLI